MLWKRKWIGGVLMIMSTLASADTWNFLTSAPDASGTVCQAVKNGDALLVVGADGCIETAPWAGFTNFEPSPSYHKSGQSMGDIVTALNTMAHKQPPVIAPSTPQSWQSSWPKAKSSFAGISTIYVYTPPDNTDDGYCGISPAQSNEWPDLYWKNSAQHINFPWTGSVTNGDYILHSGSSCSK